MTEDPTTPQPDPALRRLDRFVGRWSMEGRISVSYGPLDATFTGSWREDGTFSGGWRPNPGADESLNISYDIGGHRLA
jgi:hypothetical protein